MRLPSKAAAKKAAAFSIPHSKGFDMSQIVKFPEDFYDMGVVKFAAGTYHPLNSETQSLVNSGYAELIPADATVDHAEVLAALAKIAIDRAVAARQQADELEAEADQAVALAKAAEERGTPDAVKAQAAAAEAQRLADEAAAEEKANADAEAQRLADEAAANPQAQA